MKKLRRCTTSARGDDSAYLRKMIRCLNLPFHSPMREADESSRGSGRIPWAFCGFGPAELSLFLAFDSLSFEAMAQAETLAT